MKNKFLIRVITFSMILSVILSSVVLCTASANSINIIADNQKVYSGEQISIPIILNSSDGSDIEIMGLSLKVTYDSSKISFKRGNIVFGNSEMANNTAVNVLTDKVNIAYYSTDNSVVIASGSKLLTLVFDTQIDQSATIDVKIKTEQLYRGVKSSGGVSLKKYTVSPVEKNVKVSVQSPDSLPEQVKRVVSLINDIGTVKYNDESLKKISAAAERYLALTTTNKKLVYNYNVLLDAQKEYERQKRLSEDSKLQKKIDEFEEKWKNVLSLTPETVKISDTDEVTKCYESFKGLDADVKGAIFQYNTLLTDLIKQINVLEDKKKADKQIKEMKEEAKKYADKFKKEYKQWYTLKLDDVVAEHYEGLADALNVLEQLEGFNSYVSELLSNEKTIIKNNLTRAEKLKSQSDDPADKAVVDANTFKRNYLYLLNMKSADVTRSDLKDLSVAMEVYNYLSNEAKAMLSEEYAKLTELYNKANSLPEDAQSPTEKIVEKIVEKVVNDGNSNNNGAGSLSVSDTENELNLKIGTRSIGSVVLVLGLTFLTSLLVLTVLQVFYKIYKDKVYSLIAKEDGNDAENDNV